MKIQELLRDNSYSDSDDQQEQLKLQKNQEEDSDSDDLQTYQERNNGELHHEELDSSLKDTTQ